MPDWLPILVPLAAAFAGALLAAALALALRPAAPDAGTLEAVRRDLAGLAASLGAKQARGALAERQLRALLEDQLPAAAYAWQHTLADGRRCDALIRLPSPPGPIAVDAKFPLEGWLGWREATEPGAAARALRRFAADLRTHVDDVAARYVRPGETASVALLYLPSETLFLEVQAALPEVVAAAARQGVHIVSPGTLWAVLGTIRALLRDVRLGAGLPRLRSEIAALVADAGRLEERAAAMRRHSAGLQTELRRIEHAAQAIARAGARLEADEG